MDTRVGKAVDVVNCVGAPWFEDLSPALLDECLESGVNVVGCTACETWDDTVEAVENFQHVKKVVRSHGRAYVIVSGVDLAAPENQDKVGVVLGLQNPKPLSDSPNLLEAFIDMGLRCCGLAFRENSYWGCGFSSAADTGLTGLGREAVKILDRRGVLIDLSHAGDRTAMDAVALSEHPTIFSHSASRSWMLSRPGRTLNHGVTNSAVLRAAPDDLIKAAAAKGGVICPDGRTATAADFIDQVDHIVQLIGPDHVGIAAQDDWHRSEKDARRIQPYLPGYDSVEGRKSRNYGSDYRIHRLEGQLGAKLLYPETIGEEFRKRSYPDDAIGKILGGNLLRVFRHVLP